MASLDRGPSLPAFEASNTGPVNEATPPEYRGRPIFLSGTSASIQPGSEGSVNAQALQNPCANPIEIHEMRFSAEFPSTNNNYITGGSLAVNLSYGQFDLTNGFVPIWMMGQRRARESNYHSFAYTFPVKLKHPIIVPPGGVIVPKFQHRGTVNSAIIGRIAYIGREMPAGYRMPKKLTLPYSASYSSTVFDAGSAGTDASKETDLFNPFETPLQLARLSGDVVTFSPSNTSIGSSDYYYPELASDFIQMTLRCSNGFQVVKTLANIREVFPALTRTWEMDFRLPAKGFFTANIVKLATTLAYASLNANLQCQVNLGMHGYREVSL